MQRVDPGRGGSRLVSVAVAAILLALPVLSLAGGEADETPRVRRRGGFMGLDPGLVLRLEEGGTPLYARLDVRGGGCFNPRVHLGVDWRMDLLVTGQDEVMQKRHEIGPVLTVFMLEGWFARLFAHIGGIGPFYTTLGLQTGYEFSTGKFAAVGITLGSGADVRFDGEAPLGYSFTAALYLTAYDLGNRRGREEGLADAR